MKPATNAIALVGAAIIVAVTNAGASEPDEASQLCRVFQQALSSFPSFLNAPTQAVESSQPCVVEYGKSWRCEMQFKDSCGGASRGNAERSDLVFGDTLKAAEYCFPMATRKNIEFNENNATRLRILREALFSLPGKAPTLIVSADVVQNLNPQQCASSEISIRFVTHVDYQLSR